MIAWPIYLKVVLVWILDDKTVSSFFVKIARSHMKGK